MSDGNYTASKSRSQGRNAWTVTFRHPVCLDGEGRHGVKIRRGLGTTDELRADALVAEMNTLLADESYWNTAERPRAEQRFNSSVVRAFYEPMESPPAADLASVREREMPLPTRDDGYSRVLLMGTTGAGKTSLLRHLIGAHPTHDRFPSTSTGKTTIADIEVITRPGDFQAVVTFFPRRLIRTYVAESVLEACKTAWLGASDDLIARDLLNHKEQRFRLAYILGSWAPGDGEQAEEDWGEKSEAPEEESEPGSFPTSEERAAMQRQLEAHVMKLRELSKCAAAQLSEELGESLDILNGDDQEAAIDLILERVEKLPGYTELTDTISTQVLSRFDYLKEGKLTRRSGWPENWTFSSSDRDVFIRQIRWLSSNYHKGYGRLLTPVVQGIRVKGSFKAGFMNNCPRLVLIDGEGIGHSPESAANVSTHYTSRYQSVDAILLVDNAEQPMQAAPLSVLSSVITSGHHDKLGIAFTHFDAVKGDNFPTFAAKKEHVLASVRSALNSLRNSGNFAVNAIERRIDDRCFMLGWLDQPTKQIPQGALKQLERLTSFFEAVIVSESPPEARPFYDPAGLAFAVQSAVIDFHKLWDERLGYRHRHGVSKEHWARVKALTRRVVLRIDNYEYKHLMPVAELIARLSVAISRFLDSPAKWDRSARDGEAVAAIDRIRSEVYTALHSFTMERIIERHLDRWAQAYHCAGRGSSYERAQLLRDIYGEAAPIPGIELSELASEFLTSARKLVFRAIREAGGNLVLQEE